MKYYIKIWETQEDREQGNPFLANTTTNKEEAVKIAETLFYRNNYAMIEILTENGEIYCEYEN